MDRKSYQDSNNTGYFKYAELNQFEKPILFYDNKEHDLPNNIEVSYDGHQYHFICKKDFYDVCLKENREAQDELSENLRKLNSLRANYKYFLRVILFLIIVSIPLGVASKFLIYSLPFKDQKGILNILYLLLSIYLLGHLFRVFVTKKYKPSKYYSVFNTISNSEFSKSKYLYFVEHVYPYSTSNPLNRLFIKNIIRTLTVFLVGYILYNGLMYVGSHEFLTQNQQREFHEIAKFIFPIEVTTNYEISEVEEISLNLQGSIRGEENYIRESYLDSSSMKQVINIRDMDLRVVIRAENLFEEYDQILDTPIKYNTIIFSSMYQEYIEDRGPENHQEIVIYDLDTQSEITRIVSEDGRVGDADYFHIISFDIYNEDIYILALTARYGSIEKTETYQVYQLVNNELAFVRNLPRLLNYTDIDYFGNELYFTFTHEGESHDNTYVGKGVTTSPNLDVIKTATLRSTRIIERDNTLYLKGGAIYKLNDDFTTSLIGYDSFHWNNNMHYDSLFITGSEPETLQVLDENGNYVVREIPKIDYDYRGYVATMKNGQLEIITNSHKYTFSKTDTPIQMYKDIPDIDGFLVYSGYSLETIKSYIWSGITFLVAIPYFRSGYTLLKRDKKRNTLTKDFY